MSALETDDEGTSGFSVMPIALKIMRFSRKAK